jgi:hypothetical protein
MWCENKLGEGGSGYKKNPPKAVSNKKMTDTPHAQDLDPQAREDNGDKHL